jgi:D-alanine-D-alanine ligase
VKKKITVAVLMGGKSAEREISLMSGREVLKSLDPNKYKVIPIVSAEDGVTWQVKAPQAPKIESEVNSNPQISYEKSLVKSSSNQQLIKDNKIDIVFIALHGQYGEDGTVQGLLDLLGIKYTGSGLLASAIGMDKIYSRKIFTQAGLKVPKAQIYKKGDNIKNLTSKIKFPVFVKPSRQGSSVGVSKAKNAKQLIKALQTALKFDDSVLIEEFIEGIEITGGILGELALPLVEIVPKKEFFDYEAKYHADLTDEIVPARISDKLTKKAQDIALKAFNALGCKAFGRVDMIIRGEDIYVLELNSIPGLTPLSLLPKASIAAGISYPKLLDKIIEYSIKKN